MVVGIGGAIASTGQPLRPQRLSGQRRTEQRLLYYKRIRAGCLLSSVIVYVFFNYNYGIMAISMGEIKCRVKVCQNCFFVFFW